MLSWSHLPSQTPLTALQNIKIMAFSKPVWGVKEWLQDLLGGVARGGVGFRQVRDHHLFRDTIQCWTHLLLHTISVGHTYSWTRSVSGTHDWCRTHLSGTRLVSDTLIRGHDAAIRIATSSGTRSVLGTLNRGHCQCPAHLFGDTISFRHT